MKRGKILYLLPLIIVITLLLTNTLVAEDATLPNPEPGSKEQTAQPENNLFNIELTEEPLIPENLQGIFKLIFKLEEVKFREVVMMIGFFILAVLILQQALSMGLESKVTGWTVSVIITLMASASGTMQYAVNLWQKIGELAKLPNWASAFWMGFGIIILIIIYICARYLKETMKESAKIARATKLGAIEGMREVKEKIKAKFSKSS